MWHVRVIPLDSEPYQELQTSGWEPFALSLVAIQGVNVGLVTNGGPRQDLTAWVSMRKWIEVSDETETILAA